MKRKASKKLFDGIPGDSELDQLLGARKAKRSWDLNLIPAAHHRYRRWSERDILWILGVLEKLPKGYQATFLRRIKVTTGHVFYWRKRFIERAKVLPVALPEPTPEPKDTSHAKDHEFDIPDSFRAELDADYDK